MDKRVKSLDLPVRPSSSDVVRTVLVTADIVRANLPAGYTQHVAGGNVGNDEAILSGADVGLKTALSDLLERNARR